MGKKIRIVGFKSKTMDSTSSGQFSAVEGYNILMWLHQSTMSVIKRCQLSEYNLQCVYFFHILNPIYFLYYTIFDLLFYIK